MATLHERRTYRDQVLRVLYEAVEGNRLLGITGGTAATRHPRAGTGPGGRLHLPGGRRPDHRRLGTRQHPRDGHPHPRGNPAHGVRGVRGGGARLNPLSHGEGPGTWVPGAPVPRPRFGHKAPHSVTPTSGPFPVFSSRSIRRLRGDRCRVRGSRCGGAAGCPRAPVVLGPGAHRQARDAVDDIHGQAVSVEVVAYDHVEGRGGGSFLLVAANVEVGVGVSGAAVGEAVDQPRVAVVGENDRFAQCARASSCVSQSKQGCLPRRPR